MTQLASFFLWQLEIKEMRFLQFFVYHFLIHILRAYKIHFKRKHKFSQSYASLKEVSSKKTESQFLFLWISDI